MIILSFCLISFVLSIISFPLVKLVKHKPIQCQWAVILKTFLDQSARKKNLLEFLIFFSRADFLTFNPLRLTYRISISVRWAVTQTFLINPLILFLRQIFSPFWKSQDINITWGACMWLEGVQYLIHVFQKGQKNPQNKPCNSLFPFHNDKSFY